MGYLCESFNAEKETGNCIEWIRAWFNNESGAAKGISVNISGGKDSTIVAKLCAEAIGREKIFGLLMPNGVQKDIDDSEKVCSVIGINYEIININPIYNAVMDTCPDSMPEASVNVLPRIRMTVAYLYAQNKNYRCAGTGNLSEKYIGYCTKWGDMACDFNPVANFTSDEVIALGDYLKLPYELVHKIPSDGLWGKSDEERIGFSYEELNRYIRTGICGNPEVKTKIDRMNAVNLHKANSIPSYNK